MAALFGADDLLSKRSETGERQPVILAGVFTRAFPSEEVFLHSMEELEELAKACGLYPVCTITQKLPQTDRALYVHHGKAQEIAEFVRNMEAGRVIFNDTLSPSQIRNLQKILRVPIIDRTRLILEIFETRARTREAKLQVELAKLQYLKPRLMGLWETQNRQGGASGSMSTRGEGEKQLEIDRRTIDHRLSELRKELDLVGRERGIQRSARTHSSLPQVALVGYTNAGKSTIMNGMIELWSGSRPEKKVYAEDMLFATLDTSVRRISVDKGREFLLSDTVGFIRDLPPSLVEAFRSTLEEITQADLLVQTVDVSDPYHEEQMRATSRTITELGAGHIPMITVFNKADQTEPAIPYPKRGLRESSIAGETNENLYLCATQSSSIELLTNVILEKLERKNVYREYLIPYPAGNVLTYLMQNARIQSVSYTEDGTFVSLSCAPVVAKKAERMVHQSEGGALKDWLRVANPAQQTKK